MSWELQRSLQRGAVGAAQVRLRRDLAQCHIYICTQLPTDIYRKPLARYVLCLRFDIYFVVRRKLTKRYLLAHKLLKIGLIDSLILRYHGLTSDFKND